MNGSIVSNSVQIPNHENAERYSQALRNSSYWRFCGSVREQERNTRLEFTLKNTLSWLFIRIFAFRILNRSIKTRPKQHSLTALIERISTRKADQSYLLGLSGKQTIFLESELHCKYYKIILFQSWNIGIPIMSTKIMSKPHLQFLRNRLQPRHLKVIKKGRYKSIITVCAHTAQILRSLRNCLCGWLGQF